MKEFKILKSLTEDGSDVELYLDMLGYVSDDVFGCEYRMIYCHHDGNPNNPNTVTDGWFILPIKQILVERRVYPNVLGSPVKFKLIPDKASIVFGISDPTHLDDNLNNFRGLNSPDAYDDSNIAIGAASFGRNCPPFAYVSLVGGHDCVPFGVASLVWGAGSCSGNPDVPSDGATYGYCSLAVGKDTQAQGRISNAMGHLCLSKGMYSSTDGYTSQAGPTDPSDPDYDIYGSEGQAGTASRAHGYDSQAKGNFASAQGSFLRAYNGAIAIGLGVPGVKPLVVSRKGVGIGYGVDKPTIFCAKGDGSLAWVGFNTQTPMSKYDLRLAQSDTVSMNIDADAGESTLMAMEVKGRLGDGSFASLHNIIVTHPNAGQAYGIVQFRLNGTEYMTVNQNRDVTLTGSLEIGPGGLVIGGKRVVGGRSPAIANSSGTEADNQRAINEILTVMRNNGSIET